mgnify:CR=1 FL=1
MAHKKRKAHHKSHTAARLRQPHSYLKHHQNNVIAQHQFAAAQNAMQTIDPRFPKIPAKHVLDLLGTDLEANNNMDVEIDARIRKVWGRWHQLRAVLAAGCGPLHARLQLYTITLKRT